MSLNKDYFKQWLPFDYLRTLVDSASNAWVDFWKSDLARELTKPYALKLFGLSALLGAVIPIVAMLVWRMFSKRGNDTNNYEKVDEQSIGSFNSKVLDSIQSKRKLKETVHEDFDSIPPKESEQKEQSKNKKRHSKGANKDSDKAESSAPTTSSNEKKKHKEKSKKAAKNKESELNETRLNAPTSFNSEDFKLNEEEISELSHMELHGKLKSATLRARADQLEGKMTAEERERESMLKMQQLEGIFKLMQDQGSKFGIDSKEELMDQFKIYSS